MNYFKEIGCFNISINDGNLNRRDNRWYYGLQIDRFNKETDEWEDNNFFYIKGHKDGNVMEKSIISNAISEWFSDLTEEKVEKMYKNKRNYQFEVILPIKPQLV